MTTKKNVLSPLKLDLGASALLGTIAGSFASITLANLAVLGTVILGITISAPLIIGGFIIVCMVGVLVGRLLAKYLPIMYNFVKFGEAGGQNWLVDMGIVNLLILLTGVSTGLYFAVFKGISFLVAATNSFFWSKLWVFRGSAKQDQKKEVGKFAAATILGMGINIALAYSITLVGPTLYSGIDPKLWANIATICGSLSAMIFNFVLYKLWVFKA